MERVNKPRINSKWFVPENVGAVLKGEMIP